MTRELSWRQWHRLHPGKKLADTVPPLVKRNRVSRWKRFLRWLSTTWGVVKLGWAR